MVPIQYSFADLFGLACDLLIIAITGILLAYTFGSYLAHFIHRTGHHNSEKHSI